MARQLRAFRAGFVDVVPCGIESAFASFTPEESLDIVCGAAVSWDEATLRACVVPAPAPPTYESDEDHFEWLIAELLGAHFSTATNKRLPVSETHSAGCLQRWGRRRAQSS